MKGTRRRQSEEQVNRERERANDVDDPASAVQGITFVSSFRQPASVRDEAALAAQTGASAEPEGRYSRAEFTTFLSGSTSSFTRRP